MCTNNNSGSEDLTVNDNYFQYLLFSLNLSSFCWVLFLVLSMFHCKFDWNVRICYCHLTLCTHKYELSLVYICIYTTLFLCYNLITISFYFEVRIIIFYFQLTVWIYLVTNSPKLEDYYIQFQNPWLFFSLINTLMILDKCLYLIIVYIFW